MSGLTKEQKSIALHRKTDERSGLMIGKWKRSIPHSSSRFTEDEYGHPHNKRRINILKDRPEVESLFGYTNLTLLYTVAIFVGTLLGCHLSNIIRFKPLFFMFCYIYGGTLAAGAGVIAHECGHFLAAKWVILNQMQGLLSNIAIVLPIAASFQKYHADHHTYLGVKGKDPDLPLNIEILLFQKSTFTKLIYMCIYPLFYVGRCLTIYKKITGFEIVNWLVQLTMLLLVHHNFGIRAIYYIVVSTWLGFSIHPCAGHLIQEHFTYKDGQETYSYYGNLNRLFMNIGYHNEHHDFPRVAWNKLPQVKKIAPEYYEPLYNFNSWYGVMYTFITYDIYGPQSRVVRNEEIHKHDYTTSAKSIKDVKNL